MRIYEMARILNCRSIVLIRFLRSIGVPVLSASTMIDADVVFFLRSYCN